MIKIIFSEKTLSWPYVCCLLTQGWPVRYITQCSLFSYQNLHVLRPRCCAKHGLQNINILCKLCGIGMQKLNEKCYVTIYVINKLWIQIRYFYALLVVRMREFSLERFIEYQNAEGFRLKFWLNNFLQAALFFMQVFIKVYICSNIQHMFQIMAHWSIVRPKEGWKV